MKKYSDELFEKIEEIVDYRNHERFYNDYFAHAVNSHTGEDYEGFWSWTNGFVDQVIEITPRRDFPSFSGRTKKMKEKAEKYQKAYDSYAELEDSELKWFYEKNGSIQKKYSKEEFIKSYKDSTLPDEVLQSIWEDTDEYFYETPAFMGILVMLDQIHTEKKEDAICCTVQSYYNDDLSYGRESVGAWAGRGATGEGIGKHIIYNKDFYAKDEKTLLLKLKKYVKRAYSTIL